MAQVPWQSCGMATELAQCYIPNHPPLNQDPKPRPALGLYAKELTTAPCNPSQAHVHEMSQESKRTWGSRMGAPGKRSLTTLKSQWPCQENTITLTGPQARGPASSSLDCLSHCTCSIGHQCTPCMASSSVPSTRPLWPVLFSGTTAVASWLLAPSVTPFTAHYALSKTYSCQYCCP